MNLDEECRRFPDEVRDAYFLLRDERFVLVSSGAIARCGYGVDELIGRPLAEIVAPECQGEALELERRRLTGGKMPERYETVLLSKNGARIPVQISVWFTRHKGRSTTVGVVVDMTEKKKQEAEILQLQEALRFYAGHVVKAQEEERRRLAQELHDGTIQELLLVSHRLQDIATNSHGQLPQRAKKHLEEVRVLVERIVNEVRGSTQDLRPPILEDMGLVSALRWLTGRLATEDGVSAELRVIGKKRRLSVDTEAALFRIAQESLSNVRKHANASAAVVTLEFGEEKVAMSVSDDGRGFELPAKVSEFASQGKLGILGVRGRVHLLKGTCEIESEPGRGTVVRVGVSA